MIGPPWVMDDLRRTRNAAYARCHELATVEDVRFVVGAIEELSHDDEAAHALEDSLYSAVLWLIAFGGNRDEAQELAQEALKARGLKFSRWCA